MKKWFLGILTILSLIFWTSAWAASLPFTDIRPSDPYYSAVETLYNSAILYDDGSGLFRPRDTINRSDFVWLSVSVSCKKCITPTPEDITRYRVSPFVDLAKTHPLYYCIAYAAEKQIVQGYTLDTTGNVSCQDGGRFQSVPFCENNKTSRIEAAAMLLRQANLWNENLNRTTTRTITISDVSDYWYGYARKGIEAGILTLKNNTISPDEPITRGEFVMMAAKIFDYNQCAKPGSENTLSSAIGIVGPTGSPISANVFSPRDTFSLVPILSSGSTNYQYSWTAVDSVTGRVVTGTGQSLPSSALSTGNWTISLSVIDPRTESVVSSPSTTIVIGDASPPAGGTATSIGNGGDTRNTTIAGKHYPSITLSADTLTVGIDKEILFSSLALGSGPVTYAWDYGDGSRYTGSGDRVNIASLAKRAHAYTNRGYYTVSVTLTDTYGQVAQSRIVIEVNGEKDSDDDGVPDGSDICPSISGPVSNSGCPIIATNPYTNGLEPGLSSPPLGIPPFGGGNSGAGTNPGGTTSTLGSAIQVVAPNGTILPGSNFQSGQLFDLTPLVSSPGTYYPIWTATNMTNGQTITWTGYTLPSSILSVGSWTVGVSIQTTPTGPVVSTASTTITIGDGGPLTGNPPIWGGGSGGGTGGDGGGDTGWGPYGTGAGVGGALPPSVNIRADMLTTLAGGTIVFTSSALGVGPLISSWTISDGTRITSGTTFLSHVFPRPGTYTVTVYVTDAYGKVAKSSMSVHISATDTDGDGLPDDIDLCPDVSGDISMRGCPRVSSLLGTLEKNACILEKARSQGLIIATPVCDQCPCANSIDFGASMRSCDIIFPTILSPDLSTVYARGGFYQIP